MSHKVEGNIYYLLDDNNKVLLKLTLTDNPGNQIVLETSEEVFAGPVNLLKLA